MKATIAMLQQWTDEVCAHFPPLSHPQATVLAEASFALMTVGQWGLDTLSSFLAVLYGQPETTVRSRIREWYCEARGQKRGTPSGTQCGSLFCPIVTIGLRVSGRG